MPIDRSGPPPSQDKLDKARAAVAGVRDLDLKIKDVEDTLSGLKVERNRQVHDVLPDIFAEGRITELKLEPEGNLPGFCAKLRPYYKASISADWPEERREDAFAALEESGGGDLVSHVYTISFGRGDKARSETFREYLQMSGIMFDVRLGVPWNTLTAFIKEQIEKHKTVPPLDRLGATVGRIVEIKPEK